MEACDCGGEVRYAVRRGCIARYKQVDVDVPEYLALPTCAGCGAVHAGPEDAQRLEAALADAYTRKLQKKWEEVKAQLGEKLFAELVEVLNLPQLFSPTPTLVSLFTLYANDTRRLDEVVAIWRCVSCNEGTVRPTAKEGRVVRFKQSAQSS